MTGHQGQREGRVDERATPSVNAGLRGVEDGQVGLRSGGAMRVDWYGSWVCFDADGGTAWRDKEAV